MTPRRYFTTPQHDYDYKKHMPVVATDQHTGRLHECPLCGKRCWSVWGAANKHWQSHKPAP